MRKIELSKLEQLSGGISPGECFFALPLAIGEATRGLTVISIMRFGLCWNS